MENACLFHEACSDGFHVFASVMLVVGVILAVVLLVLFVYLVCYFVTTTNEHNELVDEHSVLINGLRKRVQALESRPCNRGK